MTHRLTTLARAAAIALVAAIAMMITPTAGAGDGAVELIEPPTLAARQALEHDPAFDFEAGAILVSEPPIYGPPIPIAASEEAIGDDPAAAASQSEVFSLHSQPGADRVIFLDLDGHTLSGTAWNSGRADPIKVGSYSREPAGSENETFSSSELAAIFEIWQRVSEDFAPWDVDVTTEYPGEDALRRTSVSDEQYGTHLVITHDSGWYAPSGGVAYIGSFGSTYYSPAFVFSNHLAQGSAKSVAEAATHEVGHTLGLLHDGTESGSTYYQGHGDWAPIMGVGYGRQVTQWSKGEYANANNTESDLDKIDDVIPGRVASLEPVGLPDEDTTKTATLTTSGGTDTYLLDTAGTVDITVSQAETGGNLLAELIVTDLSGGETTVRTITPPADPYGWSHSVDGLGSGSYRIEVRSIAYGNASTGFTDYGSIGQYRLEVDVSGASNPPAPPPTEPPPPGPDTDPEPQPQPQPQPEPVEDAEPPSNRLTTMSPARLLDTRAAGSPHDRLKAGEEIRIPVAGTAGVADDALAAVINVVAVGPSTAGFLSITPCTNVSGADRTSALNFAAGRNIANSTIATLADDGDVCIFSSAPTDVVVDVTGSIGPGGSAGLASSVVQRLVDTRARLGISGRLGPNAKVEISFDDVVDADTVAIALNVTAIGASGTGFLAIDDCGSEKSQTAALNYSAGENRGNNGIFALSSSKTLCLANTSALDLVIDLTGEFQSGGLSFVPAEPIRLLDTRKSGRMAKGASLTFDVPEIDDGPAAAASVNIASAQHATAGFVTAWDCGPMPESSALNPVAGQVTANGALVALTDAGSSCLFHSSGGQLIVDLNGWWI